MDANGVEKAILMTKASATSEDRAVRFAEAAPDRFALAVGGFNLLRPMKTVRSLESFVKDHPVAYAAVGPSFWGAGMYPASDAVYYPLYTKCCELDLRSEEHTSELQSLMRISYAVFCLKKNTKIHTRT